MTIFLAMAQRKILQSSGVNAPFAIFCHVFNLQTFKRKKNWYKTL